MGADRGAAPVGRLDLLPPDEAWWVCALRLWCDGLEGRDRLARDAADRMGPEAATRFVARLGDFMQLVLGHARRPPLRLARDSACVGADEAAFALFCATALGGDREDAMLFACLLMRPDVAPLAVSLAQTLGLDLARARPAAAQTLH